MQNMDVLFVTKIRVRIHITVALIYFKTKEDLIRHAYVGERGEADAGVVEGKRREVPSSISIV